ncbi:MAG: hypothetical protein O6922_00040 [Chloroflexi bacterium]|nr:hypothetical protein [Chloroflexota bacterium]
MADIPSFSPRRDFSVIRADLNIARELLEALGELAAAQERGSSHKLLAWLDRNVDVAVRRMDESADVEAAV